MSFPDCSGVYIFKDKSDKPIYIGKAKSLKNRISSYFQKPAGFKTQSLLAEYYEIDYIITPTELEALLLERTLIKKYQPRYNVMWKDDKQYPYLKLTINEEWPRLILSRKKENDKALYFGPFESQSVRETIRLIRKLFPIRQCKASSLKIRQQPCLQYHIKHCLSPCAGAVSRKEYLGFIKAITKILEGDISSAVNSLQAEMEEAAKNTKYELAAVLRNRIRNLNRMLEKKPDWMLKPREKAGDTGVFELKRELDLRENPVRIEAFDISNTMGSEIAAGMVVFENGTPKKSDYRRFKIRSLNDQPNDAAAIHEAVLRRYTKSLKSKLPKPNLVLVDGGIAQVRSGRSALLEAGLKKLPIIGLAKREEEIYFPEKNVPIRLEKSSPALHLLMRIRDEAHRFAIAYHRLRRRNI